MTGGRFLAICVALAGASVGAGQTLSLNGTWSVTDLPLEQEGEAGYAAYHQVQGNAMAARVPGEIHLDLMRAGRMEDPDVGDNARTRCRWPEKRSWWYRTEFNLPPGFRHNPRQRLIFGGIDLYGQVFLNGRLVGSCQDAFVEADFDAQPFLRDGSNELVVRVTAGTELAPAETAPPPAADLYSLRSTFRQRRFLRKPPYAYGWDFCDPLPNVGIWGGVRLEGRKEVVIDRLRLDTVIRDAAVALEGEAILENLHPWSEIPAVLELQLESPDGRLLQQRIPLGVPPGRIPIPCRIPVAHPQLWWPNGMGGQPLYRLTARVLCAGEETDRRTETLGLRTIELDRSPLPDGSRFCFRVNGREVFCRGGNWSPADLIPDRIEPARYEKLVADARDAHFTMFRANGVGFYERDEFYDACDRAGILVWQDFPFSEALYPDGNPEFLARVCDEAERVVKRLRHHPCLAAWVGNNECTWEIMRKWKLDPAKPDEIGGIRIYNQLLPELCRQYDPDRPYWPASPAGGTDPNSETSGDCHWWNTATFSRDMDRRIRPEVYDECKAHFVTEFGAIGPPAFDSFRQFLKPAELSFDSTAYKIHTNRWERDTTAAGIRYHYGDPSRLSLPDFVLYGQMFQALIVGGALDALRFRKDDPVADGEGALVWSFDDTWGETGWSLVDHYLRRKASYYWFRRSAVPVKILVRPRGGELVTRVVNDTLEGYRAVVRCGWDRIDGKGRAMATRAVVIPADGMVEVARERIPSAGERDPRLWLYAATLAGRGLPDDQAVWLLAPHRGLAPVEQQISTEVDRGMLEVQSPVYCHAVHWAGGGESALADDFFDLLPGVPLRVPILHPAASGKYPLRAVTPIASR